MILRTQYVTNGNGRSQILAKGGGRQRTVSVDQSRSLEWNHGNAAGVLALALGLSWHDGVTHAVDSLGRRHLFNI